MACQAPLSGILQARILEWIAIPPSGDLPNPGIETGCPISPTLAGRFFTTEPPGKLDTKFFLDYLFGRDDFLFSSEDSLTRGRLLYSNQVL